MPRTATLHTSRTNGRCDPDAPVSFQGGARGGHTQLPRARAAAGGGLLWLAGWFTRLGRHPCIWAAPRHPCATQPWMMGGHPPRVREREEEGAVRCRGHAHRGAVRRRGRKAPREGYGAQSRSLGIDDTLPRAHRPLRTHAAAQTSVAARTRRGWEGGCGRTAERIGVRWETASWNLCVLTRHGKLPRI